MIAIKASACSMVVDEMFFWPTPILHESRQSEIDGFDAASGGGIVAGGSVDDPPMWPIHHTGTSVARCELA